MDFFERQDHARRRTVVLVLVFLLAVVAIVAAVNAVAWLAIQWFAHPPVPTAREWLTSPVAALVTAITVAAIAIGSTIRGLQLAHGGGGRVAILMGGRIVDPDTSEPRERELINVVEEMAIASGTPVPCVYLLENEPGINAFAAGLHPSNAAVVFTEGALEQLTRDELQGVVAHEFSHIVNGDMRLNAQLLALLAGITVIGESGASVWRGLLLGGRGRRGMAMAGGGRRRGGGGGGGQAIIVVLAVSLALVIIGWIGVFTGRVIKAGISRQREFLADAAAVQFTRNPDGIAGALIRIAQHNRTSMMYAKRAEEVSHMGFARTVGGLSSLTATHPPIEERLSAIGRKYAWRYRQAMKEETPPPPDKRGRRDPEEGQSETSESDGGGPLDPLTGPLGPLGDSLGDALGGNLGGHALGEDGILSAAALALLAGSPGHHQIDLARALLTRMPDRVRSRLHRPDGARSVILALVAEDAEQQNAWPAGEMDDLPALRAELLEAFGTEERIDPTVRLPILEMALPVLQQLPEADRRGLIASVDSIIRANDRLSIFEFAARTLLAHHLLPRSERPRGHGRLADSMDAVRVVLSVLCRAIPGNEVAQNQAFATAMQPLLPASETAEPIPRSECSLRAFSNALEQLDELQPLAKRALLMACADCVASDGRIHPTEAELLRTIATILGVPVPPIGS